MRVLRKYPNRRIYDTQTSQFVAIAEVRQMVMDGESIRVEHSQTGEDLTRGVLVQILADMEQEGQESVLTDRVLIELIRFYGDPHISMMRPFIEQQILHSLAVQDQAREYLKNAFGQPYPAPDQLLKSLVEQYQAATGMPPAPGFDAPQQPAADEGDEEGGETKT